MRKTVLVTGAAKGIGRQIAIDFAEAGYNVCINYNTSENEAKELYHYLTSKGLSVIIYKCDISIESEVRKMIEDIVINFGSIDILVNNAGIAQYKLFNDTTQEDLNSLINSNIIGTINVTKNILNKCMINKQYGKIINISSIWGQVGASCEVLYSMTKAAIIGFTKALAKEIALSNITVNAVAPGVIDTDMIKNLNNEEIEKLREEIPLNKIGNPKDVSELVMFLASDKANYITGQVISPNGGMVI